MHSEVVSDCTAALDAQGETLTTTFICKQYTKRSAACESLEKYDMALADMKEALRAQSSADAQRAVRRLETLVREAPLRASRIGVRRLHSPTEEAPVSGLVPPSDDGQDDRRAEDARVAEDTRLAEAARREAERLEREHLAAEKLEQGRLEAERQAADKAKRDQLEADQPPGGGRRPVNLPDPFASDSEDD